MCFSADIKKIKSTLNALHKHGTIIIHAQISLGTCNMHLRIEPTAETHACVFKTLFRTISASATLHTIPVLLAEVAASLSFVTRNAVIPNMFVTYILLMTMCARKKNYTVLSSIAPNN